MEKYFRLFPIIFILHDMEEIIGFGAWLRANAETLRGRFPFMLKTYRDFSTEGFALAVAEELVVCVAVSELALATGSDALRYLWLGGFAGCAVHFVIHIFQSVILRKYIPALTTSVLFLPASVYILLECVKTIRPGAKPLLIAAAGMAAVWVNLMLAQKLIGWFTRKMKLPPII